MGIQTIRSKIRRGEYDLSEHAHKERQKEQIEINEIEKTILKGDIIEEYLKDPRGKSGLIVSKKLHVVCGFRGERLVIVTVYRPKPPTWIDYKTRAKEVKDRV